MTAETKMHVGYVLKKFPRLSETFILNEILELERQGVQVTVLSLMRPDDTRFHRRLADLRGDIVYLGQQKGPDFLDGLGRNVDALRAVKDELAEDFLTLLAERRKDIWTILRGGFEVAAEAQRRGITHLHAHFATIATQVSKIASTLSGLPYSFTCHAKDIYRDGVEPARFQRLVDGAAFAVTVCEANKRHIVENLAPAAGDKVMVLYNGIDLETFHPSIRQPAHETTLLGVGRLVEKKGFDDMIRAVAKLRAEGRTLRCVLVGDGEERAHLESLSDELGAGVEFVGACTQDEARAHMGRATLMVLPCIIGDDGNRDALPTVLLEAMASGLPSVSTPVVGVGEILGDEEGGLLVPQRDPDAVAAAVATLLDDPTRRERLAVDGRARAERLFAVERNVAVLRSAFEAGAPRHGDAR